MLYIVLQPTEEEACRLAFMIRPFLQPAIEEAHGEMEFVDLFRLVHCRLAKVWLICEKVSQKLVGVAVTEEVEYPKYKDLRVMFLGGERMKEWQSDLDDAFCQYCEENQLAKIEVVGRKGFSKALEPLGYEQAYTVLLKPVMEAYCG